MILSPSSTQLRLSVSDLGVCDCDEFSHGCCDGDKGFFAVCAETVVEGFECWVMPYGGERCHEEGLPDDGPSAFDAPVGVALPALSGVGSESGEGGCFFCGRGCRVRA